MLQSYFAKILSIIMNCGKRFSFTLDMAGKLFTDSSLLLLFIGLFIMATGKAVNVS